MNSNLGTQVARVASAAALVIAVLVVVGAKAPTCVAVEPTEPVCAAATDCEGLPHVDCVGGWGCSAGACVWNCSKPVCENPPPCVPGYTLDKATCTCVAPKECTSDAECAKGEMCAPMCYGYGGGDEAGAPAEQDVAMPCYPDPNGGCGVAPPCPNVCQPKSPVCDPIPCPAGTTFDPKSCGCVTTATGCYSSSECAPGQVCTTELGMCGSPPGCEAGKACPAVCYGTCQNKDPVVGPCKQDADCSAGTICYNGQCTIWDGGCKVDSECGPGGLCQVMCMGVGCSGGPCPVTPQTCLGKCMSTCQPTAPCQTGTQWDIVTCSCKAIPTPGAFCGSQADCVDAEMCIPSPQCGGAVPPPPPNGDAAPAKIACMNQCVPKGAKCETDADCKGAGACWKVDPCALCMGCPCYGYCG